MNAVYEGKTAAQWTRLLRVGTMAERCAAALALAELGPIDPSVKDELLRALVHPDIPVQAAARIALGVETVSAENRRKMFDGLLGTDDYERHTILQSLEWLTSPDALLTSAPPTEAPVPVDVVAGAMPLAKPPTSPSVTPKVNEPDIAVVNVLPWWFLLGGFAMCVGLAWMLRSEWWSKWAMAAAAAVAGLFLFFAWTRHQKGAISGERFRARAWPAVAAIFGTSCGFVIGLALPEGMVYIDNESGANVRLFLDGAQWMTIQTGESKRKALGKGSYQLTIKAAQGGHVFDAHEISVSGCHRYVLNVLGSQTYFNGTVHYGLGQSPPVEIVTEKWFEIPRVDYLFRDPPATIVTAKDVNKTYFTKGAPPRLKREERH